jgi:hypothetical protein
MEAQRPDGSWPRSRPLFRYPRFGNAYCYEYEMLTQILIHATPDPMPGSLKALLRLSLHRLRLSAHSEEEGTHTWPSGHHPQFRGSESWSTASVYHFLHVIRELAANELRREVFRYLGAPSPEPIAAVGYKGRKFAPGHWDSDVSIDGSKRSLKEVIHDHVLIPISECISDMKRGGQLPKHIPAAGILFGPPGSAKTTLAKCIAEWLGWPCLKIDPSHVLGKGLDQLQTEANVLFEILGSLEQTVVLLDEFDEMVRERALTASEMRSRFLTTAMLPKLISIGERRRIVLLIATNHIDQFDIAIRRPGRFDFILQVMPPNAKAKIDGAAELVRARVRDFPEEGIATLLKELGAADQVALAALTYDEYVDFLMRVARQWPMGQEAVDTALSVAYSRCTLAQVASPDYRESRDGKTLVIHACSAEERHIRGGKPMTSRPCEGP